MKSSGCRPPDSEELEPASSGEVSESDKPEDLHPAKAGVILRQGDHVKREDRDQVDGEPALEIEASDPLSAPDPDLGPVPELHLLASDDQNNVR